MDTTSFHGVPIAVLRTSGIEDFAVVIDPKEKDKAVVLKAYEEAGVSWETFLQIHPEYAPAPEVVQPVPAAPVNSGEVNVTDVIVEAPQPIVRTAPVAVPSPTDTYLVKMDRMNPYFEFGRYKFTKENPYNIMSAEATESILAEEDGFRMATPSELQSFYSR